MAQSVKKYVFFLDDESKIREVVKETLEDSDLEVECFDSPTECLAQLRSVKCDLLITDLRMPEKDGIELLAEVKQLAPWVLVLVITGYGDIPTAVKAIKGGAVDFIEKPLVKETFVRKVKSILQHGVPGDARLGQPLTRAEASILKLIIEGKSNREIANILNRSVRTIEVHRAHLMRKLGVDNVIDLVKLGAVMGIINLETEEPDETETNKKKKTDKKTEPETDSEEEKEEPQEEEE
ncbi:MAG: response regulator transcription factor [Sedimentisphaerales bacterium]|nr:response regulator transcription factor [Sedimentisphaerales bacterium]